MKPTTLDARGLSCPQPVLLAFQAMREMGSGHLEILVDNEASQENVRRAVVSQGWTPTITKLNENDYVLSCEKS